MGIQVASDRPVKMNEDATNQLAVGEQQFLYSCALLNNAISADAKDF